MFQMSTKNDKIDAVSGNEGTDVFTIYIFLTNTVLLLTFLPFTLGHIRDNCTETGFFSKFGILE